MKKVIAAACIGTSVVFLSCGTVSNTTNAQPLLESTAEVQTAQETAKKDTKSPSDIAFEEFAQSVSDLTISVTQTPKEVIAGRKFNTPFTVKAVHSDGSAFSSLSLTVTYPASKNADGILFESQTITTTEDGTASFSAPQTSFAVSSKITFAPSGDTSNAKIADLIAKKSVSAAYKVKTEKMSTGGSIALIDFTKNDKPVTGDFASSSNLLMTLMKKGFVRIGNAPYISDVAYGNQEAVYKSAKKLFGNTSSFLVYGTVKYASEVTKTENGFSLTIAADVTALDMKDGSVLYHTTKQITATDKNEWSVITAARKNLADELSNELLYNL